MPPCAATTLSASQMWPCGTMRPRLPGRMSVVKILMLAWPCLHRLGELRRNAAAAPRPSASDGSRNRSSTASFQCACVCSIDSWIGAVVRALHEIDQRRGAAVQRRLADLRRRIGQHSARPGRRRTGIEQWICGSMPPGITSLPVASTVRAASASVPGAPIVAILPPLTPMSAAMVPLGRTQVPPDDDQIQHQASPSLNVDFHRIAAA